MREPSLSNQLPILLVAGTVSMTTGCIISIRPPLIQSIKTTLKFTFGLLIFYSDISLFPSLVGKAFTTQWETILRANFEFSVAVPLNTRTQLQKGREMLKCLLLGPDFVPFFFSFFFHHRQNTDVWDVYRFKTVEKAKKMDSVRIHYIIGEF